MLPLVLWKGSEQQASSLIEVWYPPRLIFSAPETPANVRSPFWCLSLIWAATKLTPNESLKTNWLIRIRLFVLVFLQIHWCPHWVMRQVLAPSHCPAGERSRTAAHTAEVSRGLEKGLPVRGMEKGTGREVPATATSISEKYAKRSPLGGAAMYAT